MGIFRIDKRSLRVFLPLLSALMVAVVGEADAQEQPVGGKPIVDAVKIVEDFGSAASWKQADWADANKDAAGVPFQPSVQEGQGVDGGKALVISMRFNAGGFSQGFAERSLKSDWSGWQELSVDLYLDGAAPGFAIKVKPVLFLSEQWTEAADTAAVDLVPGQWVTLHVPLGGGASAAAWPKGWNPEKLNEVTGWGLKAFASNIPETTVVKVRLGGVRLSRPAPATPAASANPPPPGGSAATPAPPAASDAPSSAGPSATPAPSPPPSAPAPAPDAQKVDAKPLSGWSNVAQWQQADWADANKDTAGNVFRPATGEGLGPAGSDVIIGRFQLKGGGFSQGVVECTQTGDWMDWSTLRVSLYLDGEVKGTKVLAKPILFLGGKWTEAYDQAAVALVPGQWVSLTIPLAADVPDGYWGDKWLAERLKNVTGWAIKVFATNIPEGLAPFQLRIANPTLTGFLGKPEEAAAAKEKTFSQIGTASFDPGRALVSVGTFGSFGKGGAVETPDFEGLLTLDVKREAPDQSVYWQNFLPDGQNLVLGTVHLPGELQRLPTFNVVDWVTARMDVLTQEGGTPIESHVYLSRAFPAVRYTTTGTRWIWESGPGPVAFSHAAYSDAAGQVHTVHLAAGQQANIAGEEMGAPWILLWNDPSAVVGVVPLLISLQSRPTTVNLTGGEHAALDVQFPFGAGAISLMPLRGVQRLTPDEAATWQAGPPAAVLSEVAFWTRALLAFPRRNDESYRVNDAQQTVTITNRFSYYDTLDDWNTEPLYLAPVPPVTGIAAQAGYPVQWQEGPIATSQVATFLGPFVYREGKEVSYTIPIPAARDQMLVPTTVSGDSSWSRLQSGLNQYMLLYAPFGPKPNDSDGNGQTVKAMVQAYPFLDPTVKEIVDSTLPSFFGDLFKDDSLQTVTDPTSGQQYITSSKIWVAQEPFDREWYNGRQLDFAWVYLNGRPREEVAKIWPKLQGLYAYFRIFSDWAWSGSLSSVFGYTHLSDGMNFAFEGMLGMARLAKQVGDEPLWQDATYRAAKEALSIFTAFEMPKWVKQTDYAVVHWDSKRQPPDQVVDGFAVDGYFEGVGVETQKPGSFWESTNWVYWNNPAQLRLYADYRYEKIYQWEFQLMPAAHPRWFDSTAENAVDKKSYGGEHTAAHMIARAYLLGEDRGKLESYLDTCLFQRDFNAYVPTVVAILQAGIPLVWAPVTSTKVMANSWDADAKVLTTTLVGTADGVARYQWAWRGAEGVVTPTADPGPRPRSVKVNGQETTCQLIRGGFWQVEVPIQSGQQIQIAVDY